MESIKGPLRHVLLAIQNRHSTLALLEPIVRNAIQPVIGMQVIQITQDTMEYNLLTTRTPHAKIVTRSMLAVSHA